MYSIQFADLKAFVQFITGSPVPVGTIIVRFTDDEAEAIVANTCGRQLTLSTLIEEDVFVSFACYCPRSTIHYALSLTIHSYYALTFCFNNNHLSLIINFVFLLSLIKFYIQLARLYLKMIE